VRFERSIDIDAPQQRVWDVLEARSRVRLTDPDAAIPPENGKFSASVRLRAIPAQRAERGVDALRGGKALGDVGIEANDCPFLTQPAVVRSA
jgi:hypothetical protein